MAATLTLPLRRRTLERDAEGRALWRQVHTTDQISPEACALLLCDVWDQHWSRGAQGRLEAMVPRMDAVIRAARDAGMGIIHAPSDTMAHYSDAPARQRAEWLPLATPPEPLAIVEPPLPIDDSDEGSDTAGDQPRRVWTRQHPGIWIDQEGDIISDSGDEVYRFLQARGIHRLLYAGVHTNMCILHRSFAIVPMVRWGVSVALLRDLTDTMYNPARPPYVPHDEGTRLVIQYIESFWCPTLTSGELLAALAATPQRG